jgi:hypothetical protein
MRDMLSNSSIDQFWAQAARQQQQPQGLDIVEIVRHVVPAVVGTLSAARQWGQQPNHALGYAGNFGQQNYGQSNHPQQQGFGPSQQGPWQQGPWQQGPWQQQGYDLEGIVRAIVPAVIGAQWGQQPFNIGASFNAPANARQGYGLQNYGQPGNNQQQQVDTLVQAIAPAVLGALSAQQGSFAQRGFGPQGFQPQGGDINNLVQAIVPGLVNALSAASQWNQAQQGGFQNVGAQQPNVAAAQNPYDQQQQLFQGVDLSLLIKAIVPDITKAVVPIVLSSLSTPQQQQQSRHIN